VLFIVAYAPFSLAEEIYKTEATGKSTLDVANPEREALRDAFRNAVEKEIGVQVKAETEVENFELVKDKIATKAEGYVRNWKLLEDPQKKDGYLIVRISVEVFKGEINKELFLNGIDVNQVYDWIGKPRLLVLVADYINGQYSGTNYARNRIEDALISRGIRVMSGELLDQKGVFATYDSEKILALGKKVNAELIISGKCLSEFSREIQIGNYKQKFYTSSLQAQAWNISNKELLFAKSYIDCNRGSDVSALGDADAAKNSIQDCVEKTAKDVVFQTVKQWYASVNKPKIFALTIANVEYEKGIELELNIKNIKGVTNLLRRGYKEGVLEIEVEYEGERVEFTKGLSFMKNPKIRIVSESESTIACEVIK
jgi:hypothetical protein